MTSLLPAFGDYPIRRKLMLVIALTSVLAVLLACVGLFVFETVEHWSELGRSLSIQADILGANSVAALTFGDPKAAGKTLATMKQSPHVVTALLYGKDGRLFAAYARRDGRPESFRPPPDGYRFARGRLVASRGVFLDNKRIGTILLAKDLGEFRHILVVLLIIMATVGGGASLAAIGLAAKFQRIISDPILDLTGATRAITQKGDYAARVQKRSRDELGVLVGSFNEMLDQIEDRNAALNRSREDLRQLNAGLERRVKERTAQLEEANKDLESFSYSVSHDLRAPLRTIDFFAQQTLKSCAARLDEQERGWLERVRAAARRMNDIIDDLLTLGQVTRGPLRHEAVDLSFLAGRIACELKERQPERRATFEIDPGVQVRGDPRLLRIMLENLLGNAWKFSSRMPSGLIEFRAAERDGRRVYLVRDNGAGFDSAWAGKLFQPFVRLHSSSEFPGTGVGLAIVARVVQRHGGRIWAEGAVGKGATFYFTLGGAGA